MEIFYSTTMEKFKEQVITAITNKVDEILEGKEETHYIVIDGNAEIYDDTYVSEIYKENGYIEFQDDECDRYSLVKIDYYKFPTEALAEICDYLVEDKYNVYSLDER